MQINVKWCSEHVSDTRVVDRSVVVDLVTGGSQSSVPLRKDALHANDETAIYLDV